MTILALLAFAIPITQVRELQQGDHSRNHRHHPRPTWTLARATLRVCTDEDCIQQGAYQTLAKLKKNAKGNDIQVESCPCLGMCGLGPCVSIDWDGSRMESRGGIDALDDAAIRQIMEDTVKSPPASKTPTQQERDPYAEQ